MKVLCAAADRERLASLKRATVSANWELVGGAATADELIEQVDAWRPDVVVLEASFGEDAVRRVRESRPGVRIVSLGRLPAADAEAISEDDVRPAVLGFPQPGGPVRV